MNKELLAAGVLSFAITERLDCTRVTLELDHRTPISEQLKVVAAMFEKQSALRQRQLQLETLKAEQVKVQEQIEHLSKELYG